MNKRNISVFALIIGGAVVIGGMGFATAHGGFFGGGGGFLEKKAELLDIPVEELRQAREDGASFRDLLEEKGISLEEMHEKMRSARLEHHQEQLTQKAEMLGITVDELTAAKEEGKTLSDILNEQGISSEEFADRMLSARKDSINLLLEDGSITQEQANRKIEYLEERLANFDSEDFHFMSAKRFGHHGHRWFK